MDVRYALYIWNTDPPGYAALVLNSLVPQKSDIFNMEPLTLHNINLHFTDTFIMFQLKKDSLWFSGDLFHSFLGGILSR